MNKSKAAYIGATALFSVGILPGAVMDILQPEFVIEMIAGIGIPLSLLTLIGVWKLLGVVALAQPRFRRLNEWAYAGFFFDLTGAAYLHATAGDTVASILTPLVFLVPLAASYLLRGSLEPASSQAHGVSRRLASA